MTQADSNDLGVIYHNFCFKLSPISIYVSFCLPVFLSFPIFLSLSLFLCTFLSFSLSFQLCLLFFIGFSISLFFANYKCNIYVKSHMSAASIPSSVIWSFSVTGNLHKKRRWKTHFHVAEDMLPLKVFINSIILSRNHSESLTKHVPIHVTANAY